MPVQQQQSSFAKKLGGRVAEANAEHKDKPIDTGNRRLPAGIRNGVAKLSTMYTKEYEDDKNGPGMKGQVFFRASAVVMAPEEHDGEKTAGQITSIIIPLCDMPAKGQRKAVSFSENWFEFQNVFKLLGVAPCPETKQTDPTGQRTEAYFMAAMKTLTDPVRMKTNPTYISFSTRGWTPPPTPAKPKPEEMVFETWHGLAQFNGQFDPAAGVTASTQPDHMSAPPTGHAPPQTQQAAAPPPTTTDTNPQYQPGGDADPADVVAALVEVAMNDPEGATEEGASASAQLEEIAWAAGWTKDQTASPPEPFTNDWAGVGDMALNPPTAANPPPPQGAGTATTPPTQADPAVGSKWLFSKRSKDGAKLANKDGQPFPPKQVEVTAVDAATRTCTVKTTADGKDVVDIKTKKPVAVKFEWLEIAY